MPPARTTAPRRARTAPAKPPAKTARKPPAAAAPKTAGTPPKPAAETVPATFTGPAAHPALADAADRAADIRGLAQDDARILLKDAHRAAEAELAAAAQRTVEAEQLRDQAAAEAEMVTERAEIAAEAIRTEADESARRTLADAEENAAALLRAADESADWITGLAKAAAGNLTAEAEQRAQAILTDARHQSDTLLTEAENTATALIRSAEEQTEAVRSEAAEQARVSGARAERLLAGAEQKAAAVTSAGEDQAGQIRGQAHRDAEELRIQAERHAAEVREDAAAQADATLTDARTRVTGLLEAAREQADELRRVAEADAERVRVQVRRLREEADREIDQATDAAREVRAKAAADAGQVRAQAEQEVAAVKAGTDQSLAAAKQAEAEAQQAKQLALQELDAARETLRRSTARTARKLEKRRLKREARAAERAGKPTLAGRTKALLKANSRRLLAIVPITAPMAVAWTGQAGFAQDILGWVPPFTVLFAAAWELSTAFVAWMYHEARKVGDSGTLYRVATWVFAVGAAVMNYWHASATVTGHKWDPVAQKMVDQLSYWDPTPKAVAFSVMSITGMVLWELYARLIHRSKLRADGKVAQSRPTIGAIRWARYPAHAFTAWSLAITDESLSTVELAWTAAANHRELVRRTGLGPVRRFVASAIGVGDWAPLRALPTVPSRSLVVALSGSPNPAVVPRFAVRLTRAGSPNHTPNRPGGSPNPALPAARSGAAGGRRELEPANRYAPTGEPVGTGSGPRTAADQQRPVPAPAGSNRRSAAQELADEQVRQVLALIDAVGHDTVDLDYVMANLGMKKTTAYHRLVDARREFANRIAA
ncbi:hypothetical protein [Kitasatospora griseola]|uniref:hypothetical protein n=1 Tax=Kitasatospora griseola TaxID=2064 RepID=UPI00166F8FC6|nr:hypothetical protein [Kitasatospora griseola]GGR04374.1 hypothetical protein GCM10010195_69820 [Kitasatospora griseola]